MIDKAGDAWGKADRESGEFHLLIHHSADVAAVFLALVDQPVWRSRLRQAAGRSLRETDIARLGAIAFLHDVGKLHPGFQAKAWPQGVWGQSTVSHLAAGWEVLFEATRRQDHPLAALVRELMTWLEDESLLHAMMAHHGRPEALSPSAGDQWPGLENYDWRRAASDLDVSLRNWFPLAFGCGETLPNRPEFHHLFAGLLTLADWLGSDRTVFPFEAERDPGYFAASAKKATETVTGAGVLLPALEATPTFTELTGFPAANAAQALIATLPIDERLVILEAETGAGKTEAALIRFAGLAAAGAVSGLYFAVPTRAAARQLHARVNQAVSRIFGSAAPEAVLAIPGQAVAGEACGQRLPDWKTLWDDQPDRKKARARWAAEHAARYLTAAVAVGTVDQAMLSGLKVKYAHARGAGLSRSLLVIDEVHASDEFMTAILQPIIATHVKQGGHAMLMSATLGSAARIAWTGGSLPAAEDCAELPYPAVWTGYNPAPHAVAAAGRAKTVQISSLRGWAPETLAEAALDAARAGARVLVIRNQVDTAVACWRAVQDAGGTELLMSVAGRPAIHHSRFATEDRAALDRAVEELLTTSRDRPGRGAIVIGTQTLEQSLDIDADLLITDLCPMDVLLQRIGRLHRHDLSRPAGYATARCLVAMPAGGLDRFAKPSYENGVGAWETSDGFQGIYTNLASVELTRRLIVEHPVWQIPEMNRLLVEGATHPDHISALLSGKGPDWQDYHRRFSGAEIAARVFGRNHVLRREESFMELQQFPGNEENIMTRLGEMGPVLHLQSGAVGAFGTPVTQMGLPAHWARGVDAEEAVLEDFGDGLRLEVGEGRLLYGPAGLEKQA